MQVMVVLFFLTHSGCLPPSSFAPLFPSRCISEFFLSGPTLWVLLTRPWLWCSHFWRRLPWAMPLVHSGSSSCWQRSVFLDSQLAWILPFSFWRHPRPDSGPHAASSVLQPASLQLLPWGLLDAPLLTSPFLGQAESSLYLPPSLCGRLSGDSVSCD
jgi:hypothetical protein